MDELEGSLIPRRLRDLLQRNRVIFPGDRRADAAELAARQPANWQSVFAALQAKLDQEQSNAVNRLAQAVQRYLQNNPVKINPADDQFYVVSGLPLVTDNDAHSAKELMQGAPFAALAGLLEALAFPLWGISGDPHVRQQEVATLLRDPRLMASLAQLIAEREGGKALQKLAAETQNASKKVDAFLAKAKSAEANVNRELTAIVKAYQNRQAELINGKGRIEEEFGKFIADAQDQILAARKQATENGILLNARTLWRNKARWHAVAFWVGLAVMAVIVGSGIAWTILFGPEFLARIPKKPDGEIPYATVAMLTVCVIAAGWLLRFLGRFVTENMVMQSDASQREVMMRTYLALVGDENANMEQTDRTLILHAIFRPLPGHQADDVAPPTLADVLKSASGKS